MSLDRWTRPDLVLDLARAGLLWPGNQHDARRSRWGDRRPALQPPDLAAMTWEALPLDDVRYSLLGAVGALVDLTGLTLPPGEVEAGQAYRVETLADGQRWMALVSVLDAAGRRSWWAGRL